MITSKQDLRFYIQEDKKRNIGEVPWYKYLLLKIYHNDSYMAFHYLKSLRRLEYVINCRPKGIISSVESYVRKWQLQRLGRKYNISIGPNMVGYGFYMPHVVGGGA